VPPELVETDDLTAAALALFVEADPRTIVLAGGETPRPVYERLREVDHPWAETHVLMGDERCVPLDHPASNFGMAREALLAHVPAVAHPMPVGSCDPGAYESVVRDALGDPPRVDLAFLGIGEDGHTASLFSGDPALAETERLVVRVDRPDHPRLTLTLPVLSSARLAIFLVDGPSKGVAMRRLLAGEEIPASRVRAERVLVLATPRVTRG